MERCCASIVEHPESGRSVLGSVRRRLIARFPYAVLYTLRPDVVCVVAIMNLKRRPACWVGPNLTISRSSDGAIHGSRLHARVLKPLTELDLREDQRVRIIVEAMDEQRPARSGALARLKAGIASMEFSSDRRLPSRDGLYRRS